MRMGFPAPSSGVTRIPLASVAHRWIGEATDPACRGGTARHTIRRWQAGRTCLRVTRQTLGRIRDTSTRRLPLGTKARGSVGARDRDLVDGPAWGAGDRVADWGAGVGLCVAIEASVRSAPRSGLAFCVARGSHAIAGRLTCPGCHRRRRDAGQAGTARVVAIAGAASGAARLTLMCGRYAKETLRARGCRAGITRLVRCRTGPAIGAGDNRAVRAFALATERAGCAVSATADFRFALGNAAQVEIAARRRRHLAHAELDGVGGVPRSRGSQALQTRLFLARLAGAGTAVADGGAIDEALIELRTVRRARVCTSLICADRHETAIQRVVHGYDDFVDGHLSITVEVAAALFRTAALCGTL